MVFLYFNSTIKTAIESVFARFYGCSGIYFPLYDRKQRNDPGKQIAYKVNHPAWKNRPICFLLVYISHCISNSPGTENKDSRLYNSNKWGKHHSMEHAKNNALYHISGWEEADTVEPLQQEASEKDFFRQGCIQQGI